MSAGPFSQLHEQIKQLQARLDVLEAASPSRANSEQSIVGPPDVVDSENPALARPATLSEVKTLLEFMLTEEGMPVNSVDVRWGWSKAVQFILRRLNELDQGPIAKCCPKDGECEQLLAYKFKRFWR